MTKIIVAIPAFNEEKTITAVVKELKSLQVKFSEKGLKLDVYVINDGSKDNTRKLAESAGANRVINHPANMGLGAAVRTGLRLAHEDGADIAVKFDADLQHDPNDIFELIKPIINDEAEIVYGNRFERISYRMPFVRKLGNIIFTKLMSCLTKWPLKDSQPGIFAVSKRYLDVFYLPGDYNYTQQILIDAYHKGMRFTQVPVSFNKRFSGRSFVSLSYPFKVLPQIFQVLVGVKPMKVFGTIGALFILVGVITVLFNLYDWFIGNANRPIQNVNLVLGAGLFGVQTLFFGILADLIVKISSRIYK